MDVQEQIPEIKLHLTRVGVTNVKKFIKFHDNFALSAVFNCFVDLPAIKKGIHMSRNLEAINEIIEQATKKPIYRVEDLCRDIVLEILKRHEYASKSEVSMISKLILNNKEYKIFARAFGDKNNIEKEIGACLEGIIYSDINNCKILQEVEVWLILKGADVSLLKIIEVLEKWVTRKNPYLDKYTAETVLDSVCKKTITPISLAKNIKKHSENKFKCKSKVIVKVKNPLVTYSTIIEV